MVFSKYLKADLKLKESKCDFFKKEIHYLGHLISVDGIQPLPEKLESIHNMPKPRSPKEIKQFLGLTGYYRKFVPKYVLKENGPTLCSPLQYNSFTFLIIESLYSSSVQWCKK